MFAVKYQIIRLMSYHHSSLLFVLVFGRDGGGWQGSLYGNLARLHPPQLLRQDCNHNLETEFWIQCSVEKKDKQQFVLILCTVVLSLMSNLKVTYSSKPHLFFVGNQLVCGICQC